MSIYTFTSFRLSQGQTLLNTHNTPRQGHLTLCVDISVYNTERRHLRVFRKDTAPSSFGIVSPSATRARDHMYWKKTCLLHRTPSIHMDSGCKSAFSNCYAIDFFFRLIIICVNIKKYKLSGKFIFFPIIITVQYLSNDINSGLNIDSLFL